VSEPPPAIRRLRERKRRHQQRSRTYRITFAAAAVLVILIGLLLVPLPGPGWLIVALGLGMLALESDRAERLLERILDRIDATTENLTRGQKIALGAVAGAAVVAWIGAAILWEIPVLPGRIW